MLPGASRQSVWLRSGVPAWATWTRDVSGKIFVWVILVTLAVLVVVFSLVGVHKNQQDNRLHNDGVPVAFTVSSCTGLVGGSGSNPVGYVCHGSYMLERPYLPRAAAGQRLPPTGLDGGRHRSAGRPCARVAGRHGRHRTCVERRLPRALDPLGDPGAAGRVLAAALSEAAGRRRRADPPLPERRRQR